MKLGSLFDGSGGFPLAGAHCGITPVWASEIEPYPIAVTKNRFPFMKHYGDISKINGAEIEPVDIITFGSPCQDLSVAGKRAGLKHEANGDEETTRSGLFMEAVRIIKEMRGATNGEYPRFALWENVPGAFSSNKGEDFRIVLEELIKIVEPSAVMPAVPKKGWAYADSYCGDGWSLAYRVFDAQYWGVPQRRRRIHLVCDFGGECAGEILFEREGVRGYFAESGTPWQATSRNAENGIGTADREGETGIINLNKGDVQSKAVLDPSGIAPALYAGECRYGGGECYVLDEKKPVGDIYNLLVSKAYSIENHPADSRVNIDDSGKVQTLTSRMGTGGGNVPLVMEPTYCLQGNGIDRADTAGCNGKGWRENKSYTLNTVDRPAVVYAVDQGGGKSGANVSEDITPTLTCTHGGEPAVCYRQGGFADYVEGEIGTLKASGVDLGGGSENIIVEQETQYIVRRLTPTECARLQGFPDWWGHFPEKEDFTDEEYAFGLDVRNTHAEINGKAVKEYTEKQMLTWYNKLHTDSAEYKMWGNGIALPPALYCMQGIVEALQGGR